MKKKAQVTLFVIIAIVLVASVLLFFIFKDKIFSKQSEIPSNVRSYIQDCFETSSKTAIELAASGGGYIEIQENSNAFGITYYYFNRSNYFPTLDKVEKEISKKITKDVFECMTNSTFTNEISFDEPEVSTEIKDEEISFSMKYPIIFNNKKESSIMENFEYTMNLRLGTIYSVVEKIVEEEPLKEGICLSCVYDLALKNDLKIDMYDAEPLTTIFVVSDEKYKLNGDAFEFVFANDYSDENGI